MSQNKMNTQKLLTESFKKLILQLPFEKITIKMITDGAGVIRPSFYKYFQDKYAVFETILKEELLDSLYNLLQIEMEKEAIKMIFTYFNKNKAFYRKAFEVTGQNSFEEILSHLLYEFYHTMFNKHKLKVKKKIKVLSTENLSKYYTINMVTIIKMLVMSEDHNNVSVDSLVEACNYLSSHSLLDIIEMDE